MAVPNADGSLTAEEALEAEFSGDEPAPGAQGSEGEPPTPPASTKVKIGDSEYDESELRTLVEFQQWALEHNEEMNHFGAYLRGEAEFTPKSQAPKPEEEDDPYASIEDETLRERLRTQEQQLESLRTATSSVVTARSLEEAERSINRAYDTMKEKYGLDDDEVKELATTTAQSGILPGIRSVKPDPYDAALAALDVTFWSDPKYREKAVEKEIIRLDEHQQRQTLAGVVGGTSGSVSRDVPSDEQVAKMSPQEKASAMAAEIAASWRGTT